MKKQFLLNIFLLIVLNALIKPFWVLGIDRTVQNVVGSQVYGLYFALFNFSLLFNTLLDLGISNFNTRNIAQKPSLFQVYFPGLILLKFLLGFVYLLICLGTAFLIGYSHETFSLLFLLAFNQFLASALLFLRSNISGLQLFTIDSIVSVTDRFIMIVLIGLLLWTNFFSFKITIHVFAFSQTIAYASACIIAIAVLVIKTGKIRLTKVSFPVALLRGSWPFALLALLMSVYNRVDAILLERLLPNGPMAAGNYAQAYRIFDAVNMISVLFASLLLPMLARLLAEKSDIRPLLKLSFSVLVSGTLIVALILSYFAWPFLDVLYSEKNPDVLWVFVLLMFSAVPVSLSYIFGTLLTADGRLSVLNVIAGAALLMNVALNLWLIPYFQMKGAAFVALFSQIFVATAQMIICKKNYSLHVLWIRFLPFVFLIFLTILFSFVIDHFQMNVIWKIVISGALAAGSVFVLKIIDIQEVYKTFRSGSL